MTHRCLIVDDEPRARAVLRRHVEALDLLTVAGECPNAIAAFSFLQSQPVDLLFLDIQMPRITGLDFLRSLRHPPKTIFTTAYRDFAVEGYELDAVDYLLKPVSFERFLQAIQKAFRHMALPVLPEAEARPGQEPFLYVRANRSMVKVLLHEILYVESLKDYARIVTPGGAVVTKQPLSALEERLPAHRFFRIHRSFIVNLQHLRAYTAQEVQVGEARLPVGRLYRAGWVEKVSG